MRYIKISLYNFSAHILNYTNDFVKIILSSLEYEWTIKSQVNKNNSLDIFYNLKLVWEF